MKALHFFNYDNRKFMKEECDRKLLIWVTFAGTYCLLYLIRLKFPYYFFNWGNEDED